MGNDPHAAEDINEQPPVSRRELVVVAILLAVGISLRVAFPATIAVEHFDEGVYASNIWFGAAEGNGYPMRHLYAPPLLPAVIEWSILIEQVAIRPGQPPSELAVVMPNLLAGCLTLLLAWHVSRQWFSPTAGLATLSLAVTSDLHATYTRTALTDPLLVLWVLVGVWLGGEALMRPRLKLILGAGVATGLAWLTKYNGWLPLVITLAALAGMVVLDSTQRRRLWLRCLTWLAIAVVAALVFAPYVRSLQDTGGYAAVAGNHRQYVVGISGWPSSAVQQYGNVSHFDGVWSCLGVCLAMVLALAHGAPSHGERTRRPLLRMIAVVSATLVLALLVSSFALQLIVGLLGVTLWLRSDTTTRHPLAGWIVLAWCCGLLVATPLYHPYPRLVLPLACGGWLAFGIAVDVLLGRIDHAARWLDDRRSALVLGLAAVVVIGLSLPRLHHTGVPAWQSRAGLRQIALRIRDDLRARVHEDAGVVLVYGEPALFHELRALGIAAFPRGNLGFADAPELQGAPVYLVAGPHARRTPSFLDEWELRQQQFQLVKSYEYHPSDMVRLNHYRPQQLREEALPPQSVDLWQLRPRP